MQGEREVVTRRGITADLPKGEQERKVRSLLRFNLKTGLQSEMKYHAWQEKVPTQFETDSCLTWRKQTS